MSGVSGYSDKLVEELGAVSIPDYDKNKLLKLDITNLLARTIYAEQTENTGNAQDAVAWTIINRVLSNSREFIDSRASEVNIYNVITKPYAYTCLSIGGLNPSGLKRQISRHNALKCS